MAIQPDPPYIKYNYFFLVVLRSTNRISFLSWPVNSYSIRYFHVKLYTLSITLSYFRLNTWAGSICYCPYWWKLADLNSPQYLHFLSVLWVHLVSIWCMYYTILCCFCQEVLKIFWWVFDFYREKQDPNKEPLQACLSFLPFEEKSRSHQVFPCCQNIDLLSESVLTVSRLSNNVNKP